MQRYRPEQIIEKYRAIVGDTTDEEFFRRPHHQKTQELWCAGHFALGFEKHIGPCTVLIGDRDEQTDADFVLEWNGESLPFQITEVMEPGRRRGDEYRDGAIPPVRSDDWSRGSEHGPLGCAMPLKKKRRNNTPTPTSCTFSAT